MSETTTGAEYGYQDDNVKQNPFDFGLNAGVTYLKDFKWIPNGGKDGAEQPALEIIFTINDTDKSYRKFPVIQGFGKNQEKITDPSSKEFKDAVMEFNATIVHILRAFADEITVQTALAKKVNDFKDFCKMAAGVLPKEYSKKKLDIFLQYQWKMAEDRDRTYLDIPVNMKHGKWLCPAVPGTWEEHKVENPADSVREALYYTNEKGEKHPFVRKGWFMNSNFASQQREDGATDTGASTADEAIAGEAQNAPVEGGKKAAW